MYVQILHHNQTHIEKTDDKLDCVLSTVMVILGLPKTQHIWRHIYGTDGTLADSAPHHCTPPYQSANTVTPHPSARSVAQGNQRHIVAIARHIPRLNFDGTKTAQIKKHK